MPKLTVPAAGEAVPAAEGMPIIGRFSRRALLGAFASVPAVGVATEALSSTGIATPELPCIRVRRLARERALALDDWSTEIGNPFMVAHIYPASMSDRPIAFEICRSLGDGSIQRTGSAYSRS